MKGKDFKSAENLLKVNVEAFERHIIVSALARTRGNQTLAAQHLGTTVRVIAHRMRKYRIDVRQFQDGNRMKHRAKPPTLSSG